jgi:biofilm PGA synthesis N-glycosyltransferase PgaC
MFVACLVIFWVSFLGIAYTYVGYALIIALLARWRPHPVIKDDISPSVTMLVAAYNEEDFIGAKIENALALDYPPEKLEVVVVTDGSTDRTNEIVASYADRGVHLLYEPERGGKPAALIRAFPLTHGEVVVFSDANCYFAEGSLRKLVRSFADPQVGGVGGAKRMFGEGEGGGTGPGESLYWRYESCLKAHDSAVSSVMGVPGEIWAARRSAYVHSDPDSYIEDFVASLRMVEAGWRVVFEPEALAFEEASPSLRAEWTRRTRMSAGGWQSLAQLPGMLRHENKLLTFQYISHRMLRWLVTPSLFLLLFVANLGLVSSPLYASILGVQLAFYTLACVGWFLAARGRRVRWLAAPFYVCLLNAAALAGGWRFLRGRQPVAWDKAR